MAHEHKTAITAPDQKVLKLPKLVVSQTDVKRLLRELAALADFLHQSKIRSPGTSLKLPKTSRWLDDLAADNNLNLLHLEDLEQLKAFLTHLRDNAPLFHISFSSEPSAAFTEKIVTWFRREIHPYVLLQIGLQPTLAVGCILRTANHQFDLSMRKAFHEKRTILMEKLGANLKPDAATPTGATQ